MTVFRRYERADLPSRCLTEQPGGLPVSPLFYAVRILDSAFVTSLAWLHDKNPGRLASFGRNPCRYLPGPPVIWWAGLRELFPLLWRGGGDLCQHE